jgi:hypothetical protein
MIDGITIGSEVDCDLPAGGALARIVLFDRYNLVSLTEVNGVITNIQLLPGTYGYEFLGYPNTASYATDYQRTGVEGFIHRCNFLIPDRTQPQKENINAICQTRVCVIVFNNDGTIELGGKESGMEVLPGNIHDANNYDGFYYINLSSPDGESEEQAMKYILNQDVVDEILQRNRYILLETGWYIQLENGDRILLE